MFGKGEQNTLLSKEGEQRAERLLQRAAKQRDCGKSSSRDQRERERERERGGGREGGHCRVEKEEQLSS